MKNIKCYPFERNQYFFGKLLTVSDFDAEQRYVNDKRRLINRLLFGTGVVCGMNTTKVDDTTVVIESGFALDGVGREIVVEKSTVKKLSMIDGFDSASETTNPYIYLCIAYNEVNAEPVHSITENASKEGQYNKVQEDFKLFLTYDEPQPYEYGGAASFYRNQKIVYEGNGIIIRQSCVKYVSAEAEFDLIIEIEKIKQSLDVKIEYELSFAWVDHAGEKQNFLFNEADEPVRSTKYTKVMHFKAANVNDAVGSIELKSGSFSITVGTELIKPSILPVKNNIHIYTSDIKQRIFDDYYSNNLEKIYEEKMQEKLYLAKIHLVKWGAAYEIGEIEQVPFDQRVYTTELSKILDNFAETELSNLKSVELKRDERVDLYRRAGAESQSVLSRSGDTAISIPNNARAGQVFYSGNIAHGLGIGDAYIVLGLSGENGAGKLVFGDNSIFKAESGNLDISFAALADPETGTFRIGIKLKSPTDASEIKISWIAYRDQSSIKNITNAKSILVKPDISYIKVRETIYFEAIVEGVREKDVTWSVKERNGGSIDKRGQYTAPNTQGVYEIIARSKNQPDLVGSAFVAVK